MNYGRHGAIKRRREINSKEPKFINMFLSSFYVGVIILLVTAAAAGCSAGLGIFRGILASAPSVNVADLRPTGYSSVVYDNAGNQLTKLVAADSNRIYQTIDKIPLDMQHAFVAIEDERFYEHNGIDIKGIARAAYKGITTKDFSEGASTITQQLIKNNVFSEWKTGESFADKVKRKIQEQYLAVELEKQPNVTKDIILELYLNTINLGQNTLGVQAASLRYFNKPVSDLDLSEDAVIAAITNNPSLYNPISHPDKNAERRKKVLDDMLEQGYITQTAYDEAINDDVYSRIKTVNEQTEDTTINTYFVDALTQQILQDMKDKLGYTDTQAYNKLYSGGLSIYTTQDSAIQSICDEVCTNEDNYPANTKYLLDYQITAKDKDGNYQNFSSQMMEKYFKEQDNKYNRLYSDEDSAREGAAAYREYVEGQGYTVESDNISITPQPQISITVEDQSTGYIKAIVGGRGAKEASLTLNRATDTKRQPGSTFKIVSTYAPAFDSGGRTLASVEVDEPYAYSNGRPVSNWYGEKYKGICTLRYGIEQSLNIIAVKTLTRITPQLGFEYLKKFGFTTLVDREVLSDGSVASDITQALALGGITHGVKNYELNAAYAAIANGGTYIRPVFYTKILDHDGNILIDNTQPESHQVIKPTTAFLLTSAMKDVVSKGTGVYCNFAGQAIAGKTGTTSDEKDVWFAGYTPYYTCTAWAGYDNNIAMYDDAEQHLAKSMWKNIMSKIHENLEYKDFTTPEGITTAVVCSKSGQLAVDGLCTAAGTAVTEYFASDNVPTETCTVHQVGLVCAATGLRASDTCPYKTTGIYMVSPDGDGGGGGTGFCPHSFAADGTPLYTGSLSGNAIITGVSANSINTMNPDGTVNTDAAAALAAQAAAQAAAAAAANPGQ